MVAEYKKKLCRTCQGTIRLTLSPGFYECVVPIKCQHKGLCIHMALDAHGVSITMNGAKIPAMKPQVTH